MVRLSLPQVGGVLIVIDCYLLIAGMMVTSGITHPVGYADTPLIRGEFVRHRRNIIRMNKWSESAEPVKRRIGALEQHPEMQKRLR
jgi:hypothetical protein